MKILYVITSTETGGAEKALAALATQMKESGHHVEVICIKALGRVAEHLQQQGIAVHSIAHKLPGQTVQQLKAEIARFRPDIIHAMLFRAIEYTRMACSKTNIPLIVTPHFDLSKKSFILRMADRFLKEKDTLTVAESFATAQYLIKHQGYRKDKVYLLPNGVDRTQFFKDNSLRTTTRKQYSFHVKTPVFVCVARLAKVKDPLTLVQAFRNVQKRYPEARLVYVGEGAEREKLTVYIQASGLEKSVMLAGEQTNINAYLNMADIFVLPSIEESLPLALLEALSVGLPCIVSRVGDMPRWVEHGVNGFVFPAKDVTLLSCFMSELVQNTALRAQMGVNSLEKAAQITNNFEVYEQIYRRITDKSFHVKTNEPSGKK